MRQVAEFVCKCVEPFDFLSVPNLADPDEKPAFFQVLRTSANNLLINTANAEKTSITDWQVQVFETVLEIDRPFSSRRPPPPSLAVFPLRESEHANLYEIFGYDFGSKGKWLIWEPAPSASTLGGTTLLKNPRPITWRTKGAGVNT